MSISIGTKILFILANRDDGLLVLYSAANDPQTGNDPQIGPQMIPDVNRKWSRRKITDGMDFGFLDFFENFFRSFFFLFFH